MPPRRLLVGREAELAAAYAGGATVEELAKLHGCSVTTVRDVLEAQGVERRRRGPRSPLEGRQHEVAAAYEAGGTVRQLAETFAANQRTIRKVLTDAGVTMRPPGRKRSTA